MMREGVAALVLVVALGLLTAAVRMARSPISRAAVETFARRQQLVVTAANGPLVVRSLALARSWRRLGLWTGIVCGFLWALQDERVTLNFTTAFLGWFVGAVVAEWRIAGFPPGNGRRAASLERRTVSGYLRTTAKLSLCFALLLVVGSFVTVLLKAGTTDSAATTVALLWAGAYAVCLALVGLTLRRVATRRQPPAAPDLVAADDALRARATAVLAGSVTAASGLPVAAMFELLGAQADAEDTIWVGAGLGMMLLLYGIGFVVATTAAPRRHHNQSSDLMAVAR